MTSFRAAVVQSAAAVFDREASLDKLARLAREVRKGGAELVVFPEAFLPGYPRGMSFGTVVGNPRPRAEITSDATGRHRSIFRVRQ
jgi:nitrilase